MGFWLVVKGDHVVINGGGRAKRLTRQAEVWVFWWIGAIRPFATTQDLGRILACGNLARKYARHNPNVRDALSCAHILVRYPWDHSLAAAPIPLRRVPAQQARRPNQEDQRVNTVQLSALD